jgi:hypothetical protein
MQARLPSLQSILQVYAVAAFLFSAWTITAFLWKLSAWLMILNLGEILTIFSYGMVVNFVESLLVLLALLCVSFLLPSSLLRDDFVVRGSILAAGIVGAMMAFTRLQMAIGMAAGASLWLAPIAVLLFTAILLVTAPRVRFLRVAVAWISDRLTIFLYLLVPLFVLLSLYVAFRNFT